MFTTIHNKSFKNHAYLLIAFACLLLLLSAGQDLFHNHEPDSKTHQDCPAHQIYLMLSAAIVCDCAYWLFYLIALIVKWIFRLAKYSISYTLHHSRAPPFQLMKIA